MTPETRPCVRCRVQINAASGYCTLCGAVQRRRRAGGRLLLALGTLLALSAAGALVVVLVRAASPARTGQLRPYRSPVIATAVPAGWVGGPTAASPAGTATLVFIDPQDDRSRLIVTAVRPARATALVRAGAARRRARSGLAYRLHYFGHVLLGPGRPAYLLTYDANDSYHAVYSFSACLPTYAMTVELRAHRRSTVGNLARRIAASSLPRC